MPGNDRRSVMGTIGALTALSLVPVPLRASTRGPIVFPARPVTLERVLERQLADGAMIRVSRRWDCRFERLGAGASVHARQVFVLVEAPEALAALAQMERAREANDMFPLELDRTGLIVGWAANPAENVDLAVARALRVIEASLAGSEERGEARRFLASVSGAAATFIAQVPRDLFFPEPGQRSQAMPIELADGIAGSYEVAIAASAAPDDGLLKSLQRRVVTHVGDTSRLTCETWTILSDD